MSTFSIVSQLTLTEKRALVVELRDAIKQEVLSNKQFKALQKVKKDNAKKEKIQNAIKAAELKLAKLQAKLQ